MNTNRLEALTDAIFAIVMTLLVLELKVPAIEFHGALLNTVLTENLLGLWPKFLAFVISFVIIATYWNSHHIQFAKVKASNISHIWMNMFFLLFVCLIPFSAALIGEYPYSQSAQFVYGGNLVICSLALYTLWSYAISENRLVEEGSVSKELRFNAKNKVLLPPILYLLGMIASFFDTTITLYLFVLGPVIYFIPVDTKTWEFLTDPFNRHRPHF